MRNSIDFRDVTGLFILCCCGRPDEQVFISGEQLGMSEDIAWPMEKVEGGYSPKSGKVRLKILTPGTQVFPLY